MNDFISDLVPIAWFCAILSVFMLVAYLIVTEPVEKLTEEKGIVECISDSNDCNTLTSVAKIRTPQRIVSINDPELLARVHIGDSVIIKQENNKVYDLSKSQDQLKSDEIIITQANFEREEIKKYAHVGGGILFLIVMVSISLYMFNH